MTWLFKSSNVDYLFGALLSMTLFLTFRNKIDYMFLSASILLFLFTLRRPYILLGALLLYSIVALSMFLQNQNHLSKSISGIYEIKKITSSGPIIKIDGNNVLVRSKDKFNLFDEIEVSGIVETPKNFATATFDYVAYLKTMNVENIISNPTVHIVSSSNDLRAQAFTFITNGPESYRSIAPLVLLGIKTPETKEAYNIAVELSIVHLFVISGFHISLFYIGINKALKLLRLDKYFEGWLPLMVIFIYLFFMNFPLSASRAFFLHVLVFINKKFLKSKVHNIILLSLTMSGMMIYKPYSVTSLSFIFTFLATAVIMIINDLKFKNDFRKFLVISIGVYLATLPISIYINGYFAPEGFLMGIVFTPILVVLYSVTLLFFPIKGMMDHVYWAFLWFLGIMKDINVLIEIPKPNLFTIQFFYILSLASFIIGKIWYLFMARNNT